ncbi:MAG TPA: hypothetical protein VNI57_03965, partial [Candidatus Saccharimonadales bacterium]|nr:hypothetical protein [Candidatus Saccharimonadales bacterium]
MARRLRGRLASLAVNAGLGAASVAIVFGLAEASLRVTGLAPSHALRSPDLETLERIPGIYAPGQDFTDRVRPELPSHIRINSLGFRGAEVAEKRPPGVLRVLALGDSYTFGDHVDTELAYPARLEGILRERIAVLHGGWRGAEVINAGANGFGILDMESLYAKAGDRLDPSIVLITFSPNDVSDMTRAVPMIDQMRANAALKSRPLLGPALRVLQDTAIFNGMQILAARWKIRSGGHDALPALDPARAGPEAAPGVWEAYRQELGRFAGTLREDGRRALLVLYPSVGQVTGEEAWPAGDLLPRWAAESGLRSLDLLPALREAARKGEKLYLVPLDSH